MTIICDIKLTSLCVNPRSSCCFFLTSCIVKQFDFLMGHIVDVFSELSVYGIDEYLALEW